MGCIVHGISDRNDYVSSSPVNKTADANQRETAIKACYLTVKNVFLASLTEKVAVALEGKNEITWPWG